MGTSLAGHTHRYGAGTNTGKLSDNGGVEMCAKWVIFGGFGRQKGGEKGVFWASEAWKKAPFRVPEGWMADAGGFSGQTRTLCQLQRPAQSYPRGRCYG